MKKVRQICCFILALILLFTNCGLGNLNVEAAKKESKKPTKITLSDSKKNLAVGETFTLKVKSVKPSNASKSVTWSSSNKKIATVSKKGKVKAKKTGSVTITAKSTVNNKVVAKCKIKVYKATKKMQLNSEKSYELTVGQTQTLSAKVTNPKKGAAPIEWSSSDKKVAKVSSKGKVTTVAEGKATITAKSGKKKVKVSIVVTAKEDGKDTGNKPGTGDTQNPGGKPDGGKPSDKPSGDAPSGDAPSGDAPSGDTPSGDAPSGDDSSGDAPSGDAPSGDDPSGDAPSGDAPSGDTPPAESIKTKYTRGEWVAALSDKMGYSISENNLPKDSVTGVTLNSFLDIYDNENVMKIEAATYNGIVPLVEEDGSVNNFFFPDENVTREFAAVTAVRALGYVTNVDIESSDSSSVNYPKEAKIAIEKGMFTLIDGAFCPNELVTEDEFTKIMEIVDASLAEWEFDPNHVDKFEYTDAVVECEQSIKYYDVSTVDGKLQVTVSANSFTQNLQEDQILLLPANIEFNDGLPIKIESISESDDEVVLTGQLPTTFEEVYESVDIECIGQIDVNNIIWAEDVTFVEERFYVSDDTLDRAGKVSEGEMPTPLAGKFEANLGSDYGKVGLGFSIPNVYCKFNYDKDGVHEVIVKVPSKLSVGYSIEKEWKGEKLLGYVPVSLPAGFSVDIAFSLVAEANGSFHIEYNIENTIGVRYKEGEKLQKISEHKEYFEGEMSVEAKAGIKMEVDISWMATARNFFANITGIDELAMPIYTVGTELGIGANAKNTYRSSLNINCTDANMWMYWDLFVGVGDTILTKIFPDLEYKWKVFNESNSPLRVNFHLENLRKVDACCYENGNFSICVYDHEGNRQRKVQVTMKSKDTGASTIFGTDIMGEINAPFPAGIYEVYVTKTGKASYSNTIELKKGEITKLDIVLQPKESGKPSTGGLSGKDDDTDKGDTGKDDNLDKDDDTEKDNDSDEEHFWTDPPSPGTGDSDDDSETAQILYSGTWNGLEWSIDEKGKFLVTGEDTRTNTPRKSPDWLNYKAYIKTATINAKGIKSTYKWFDNCFNLSSLDSTNMNTSNINDMAYMFNGCSSLISVDAGNWDASNVSDMKHMFNGCSSLTNVDVGNWNTSNVVDMSYMFNGCSSLSSIDVNGLDTSSVIYMNDFFNGCNSLENINMSGLDTSNVIYMDDFFNGCSSLKSINMSGLDMGNVIYMANIFNGCSSLESIDLRGLDTSKVTDMSYMFWGCSSLERIDLQDLDMSNVTDMSYMFWDCSNLESIDLRGLDTSKVKGMSSMFGYCEALTSIDLSGLDTSEVTGMDDMFIYCKALTSIDLRGLDTSKVTDMRNMFNGCSSLESIDMSGLDLSNTVSFSHFFTGCESLLVIQVPLNIDSSYNTVSLGAVFIDANGNEYSTLPTGVTESFEITRKEGE